MLDTKAEASDPAVAATSPGSESAPAAVPIQFAAEIVTPATRFADTANANPEIRPVLLVPSPVVECKSTRAPTAVAEVAVVADAAQSAAAAAAVLLSGSARSVVADVAKFDVSADVWAAGEAVAAVAQWPSPAPSAVAVAAVATRSPESAPVATAKGDEHNSETAETETVPTAKHPADERDDRTNKPTENTEPTDDKEDKEDKRGDLKINFNISCLYCNVPLLLDTLAPHVESSHPSEWKVEIWNEDQPKSSAQYQCPFCFMSRLRKLALLEHISHDHQAKWPMFVRISEAAEASAQGLVKCPLCSHFSELRTLNTHTTTAHGVSLKAMKQNQPQSRAVAEPAMPGSAQGNVPAPVVALSSPANAVRQLHNPQALPMLPTGGVSSQAKIDGQEKSLIVRMKLVKCPYCPGFVTRDGLTRHKTLKHPAQWAAEHQQQQTSAAAIPSAVSDRSALPPQPNTVLPVHAPAHPPTPAAVAKVELAAHVKTEIVQPPAKETPLASNADDSEESEDSDSNSESDADSDSDSEAEAMELLIPSRYPRVKRQPEQNTTNGHAQEQPTHAQQQPQQTQPQQPAKNSASKEKKSRSSGQSNDSDDDGDPQKPFRCSFCPRTFTSFTALRTHLSRTHPREYAELKEKHGLEGVEKAVAEKGPYTGPAEDSSSKTHSASDSASAFDLPSPAGSSASHGDAQPAQPAQPAHAVVSGGAGGGEAPATPQSEKKTRRAKLGDEAIPCSYCERVLPSLDSLRRHMASGHPDEWNLEQHSTIVAPAPESDRVECPFCEQTFSRMGIQKHMNSRHRDQAKGLGLTSGAGAGAGAGKKRKGRKPKRRDPEGFESADKFGSPAVRRLEFAVKESTEDKIKLTRTPKQKKKRERSGKDEKDRPQLPWFPVPDDEDLMFQEADDPDDFGSVSDLPEDDEAEEERERQEEEERRELDAAVVAAESYAGLQEILAAKAKPPPEPEPEPEVKSFEMPPIVDQEVVRLVRRQKTTDGQFGFVVQWSDGVITLEDFTVGSPGTELEFAL